MDSDICNDEIDICFEKCLFGVQWDWVIPIGNSILLTCVAFFAKFDIYRPK